ncbi:MAG: hypothetical protein ACKOB2_07085 [Solirubrobacterales bacterium]
MAIPDLDTYLTGFIALLAILASLWLAGYWLGRWIVPQFSGALARLADLILASALLVLILQLVGSLGLLKLGWIVGSCIVLPLLVAALAWRMAPDGHEDEVAAPSVPTWAFLVAIGVASWTVAEWSFPTQLSLDQGMFGGDTTWYHMPASARFVQDHSIIPLHFTDPLRLAVWFYPQTSELMHGALIALMKTDWLSPLFNMYALGVALLAGWVVGRPYGVGPATLVAVALLLSSGVMIETQPGEGRNDILAFAFLLAFAAFLVNGHQRRAPGAGEAVEDRPDPGAPLLDRGPLLLAGVAAGLAISVKVSMLAPVGVIFLGMIFASGRARWLTTTLWLGIPMFLVGGYWYVRAMFYTGGNPVPAIGWGPLRLPQPDQMPLDPRPRFSVADYATDIDIYRFWFLPELEQAFGVLFPLIFVVLGAAAVYVVIRSRNRVLRVIAGAAILTAIVYLFTPLTAAGQEGAPRGFFTNTRYLLPGLLLAASILPLAKPLRSPPSRASVVLAFLTVVYAITVLTSPRWSTMFLPGAIFLVLAIVWAPVGLTWLREQGRISLGALVAAALAVVLVAGIWGRGEEVGYAEKHYTRSTLFLQDGGPQETYDFVRDLTGKRIAVAGSGQMIFGQYGFYGVGLDNYVQYVGQEGDRGTFRLITKCRNFVEAINRGNYDFVFTSEYTQDSPDSPYRYPVREWIASDPNVTEVVSEPAITPQPAFVYRVDGKLNPDLCR